MTMVFQKIDPILSRYSYRQVALVSLLLIASISAINLMVGYELAISIFYLIPISISTWYGSHRTGMFFSILYAFIWFLADYSMHPYINPAAPYWNSLVRLGFS